MAMVHGEIIHGAQQRTMVDGYGTWWMVMAMVDGPWLIGAHQELIIQFSFTMIYMP
jgi:hypothetical protein